MSDLALYLGNCVAIALGLGLWYVLYGVTLFINGAMTFHKDRHWWSTHLRCLWEEFTWAIPFYGRFARIDYLRKIHALDVGQGWQEYMLPGLGSFLGTHVLVPLTPFCVWLCILALLGVIKL